MMAMLFTALLVGAPVAGPAMIEAPVLIRTVEKGDLLSTTDFVVEPVTPGIARNAMRPEMAAGQEARRRLVAGAPVRSADVVRPRLVHRGEAVTITLVSGALTITTAGRALSDGGAGDSVRVVSVDTNRTLDAIVEQSGRVRLAGR